MTKPQINMTNMIPSQEEIDELEKRLQAAKAIRESAKANMLEDVIDLMEGLPEQVPILPLLKLKLKVDQHLHLPSHLKIRGHKVPDELKLAIANALKSGEFSLSDIESLFGVSMSYVARLKAKLGLTGGDEGRGRHAKAA